MKKQASTSSTVAMLEAAEREERRERASDLENGDTEGVAGISAAPASTPTITITGLPVTASNTVVPIREEFRCRRFWLFYHDLRAFTTSWMPLPLFVVYRVLVLLYMLSWLIASGVDRGDKQGEGGKWLIFITNHTLLLINIGFLAITALTVGYAVVYYIDKSKLQRFYPKPAPTAQAFYSQDNIAWYVKICWVLYIVGVSSEIANICGFWVAIYEPCPPDDAMAEMTNSSLNSTSNDVRPCSNLDAISIHVHLILGLLALIDIYLSRVPYQILHFFYSISYMAFFVVFSGIYFAAEGTDHLGNPYIYSVLDYRESPAEAVGFCIVIVILPMIMYIILFLLAWLRDVIYSRIRFCFWDLRRSSTYCVGSSEKENGQWGPTTKVEVTTKV